LAVIKGKRNVQSTVNTQLQTTSKHNDWATTDHALFLSYQIIYEEESKTFPTAPDFREGDTFGTR